MVRPGLIGRAFARPDRGVRISALTLRRRAGIRLVTAVTAATATAATTTAAPGTLSLLLTGRCALAGLGTLDNSGRLCRGFGAARRLFLGNRRRLTRFAGGLLRRSRVLAARLMARTLLLSVTLTAAAVIVVASAASAAAAATAIALALLLMTGGGGARFTGLRRRPRRARRGVSGFLDGPGLHRTRAEQR